MHPVRVLGILENGTHVFAQYTPFYLGHPRERESLWICEGYGWATKPTHWMLLPSISSTCRICQAVAVRWSYSNVRRECMTCGRPEVL